MSGSSSGRSSLTVLESVRCLECGTVYPKPSGGGTAEKNPGCPECGYVGWISTAVSLTPSFERRRSAGDPLPGRHARPG